MLDVGVRRVPRDSARECSFATHAIEGVIADGAASWPANTTHPVGPVRVVDASAP
jgi:hypothetical protein